MITSSLCIKLKFLGGWEGIFYSEFKLNSHFHTKSHKHAGKSLQNKVQLHGFNVGKLKYGILQRAQNSNKKIAMHQSRPLHLQQLLNPKEQVHFNFCYTCHHLPHFSKRERYVLSSMNTTNTSCYNTALEVPLANSCTVLSLSLNWVCFLGGQGEGCSGDRHSAVSCVYQENYIMAYLHDNQFQLNILLSEGKHAIKSQLDLSS